jgi:hypothetical protein
VLLSEMLCEVAHVQGYPEAKSWWLGPLESKRNTKVGG